MPFGLARANRKTLIFVPQEAILHRQSRLEAKSAVAKHLLPDDLYGVSNSTFRQPSAASTRAAPADFVRSLKRCDAPNSLTPNTRLRHSGRSDTVRGRPSSNFQEAEVASFMSFCIFAYADILF